MAKKDDLRNQREGTVINTTSKRQEKELDRALEAVCSRLLKKFPGITLKHDRQWFLKDVVASLSEAFPEVDFHYYHDTSFMKPDGGILKICAKGGAEYPILIAEKKNQGTNDLRIAEGKGKQAKGNAIERLGKNVIGNCRRRRRRCFSSVTARRCMAHGLVGFSGTATRRWRRRTGCRCLCRPTAQVTGLPLAAGPVDLVVGGLDYLITHYKIFLDIV